MRKLTLSQKSGLLLALLGLCLASIGITLLPRLKPEQASTQPELGWSAPDFLLPVLGGALNRRLSDYSGKKVVLDFWASWCVPCAEQAEALKRVAPRLAQAGIVLLGVATDDQAEQAEAFAKAHGLPYVSLLDEDGAIAREFGVEGLPTLLVIGADRKVQKVHARLANEAQLIELLSL